MVYWDMVDHFDPFYASGDCRSGLRKSTFWQACGLSDQYLPSTANKPPEKAMCYDFTGPTWAEGIFALERSDRFYFSRSNKVDIIRPGTFSVFKLLSREKGQQSDAVEWGVILLENEIS